MIVDGGSTRHTETPKILNIVMSSIYLKKLKRGRNHRSLVQKTIHCSLNRSDRLNRLGRKILLLLSMLPFMSPLTTTYHCATTPLVRLVPMDVGTPPRTDRKA